MRTNSPLSQIDWPAIAIFVALIMLGYRSVIASSYSWESKITLLDFSRIQGKQLVWIAISVVLGVATLLVDYRYFESFAPLFYFLSIAGLLLVMLVGTEISGARSWFDLGGFSIQPSEFTKISTALMVSRILSSGKRGLITARMFSYAFLAIAAPLVLIILQGDLGTALIFSSFILVFFREGLSPTFLVVGLGILILLILSLIVPQNYIIMGVVILALTIGGILSRSIRAVVLISAACILCIGLVKITDVLMNQVLKPYQKDRILAMVNPGTDPLGTGWNVTQSKIAIGSGGWTGKGYLKGTQTKFDFVPAQSTDFIFCTLGEEYGWIGSTLFMILFTSLLYRVTVIAERQRVAFSRMFGYGVAGILFFHFFINIAMTVGMLPVIGIPLPFISYGGSSLLTFSLLLFILLKLDLDRNQMLIR